MMNSFCKLLLWVVLNITAAAANAQQSWPSPEIEQMYRNGQDAGRRESYKEAIIIYRQALVLAPGNIQLTKGLAGALTQTGNYSEARDLLKDMVSQKDADAECFHLLAVNEAALGHEKKAVEAVTNGLEHFPSSGLLYHTLGDIYQKQRNKDALNAWLDGIEKDISYPANYRAAAMLYLNSDRVLWGLLYAEEYLNLTHDTLGDGELIAFLYAGYKAYFDKLIKSNRSGKNEASFEDAVTRTFATLTPVVSDGIDVESLTMLRVRFILEWSLSYAAKYPFSLFQYQEDIIKNGWFDIYNEWLFGQAESVVQFNAWNTFHKDDLKRFDKWHTGHQLVPVAQFYNPRNMDGLFTRKK